MIYFFKKNKWIFTEERVQLCALVHVVNNSISWTVTDIMALNEEIISTDLLITASKSWTQIATKLKSIPKMYSQKFCTLIFLEGRFLIIAYIFQKMKHVTLLKKFFVTVPIKCIIPKLFEEKNVSSQNQIHS